MAELVRVVDGVNEVLYEGDFSKSELREISTDERVGDYVSEIEARASSIVSAVESVVSSVRTSFDGMVTDEARGGVLSGCEVGFGLKVSGEGNWFVAKAGAEVNLNIKVSWDFS